MSEGSGFSLHRAAQFGHFAQFLQLPMRFLGDVWIPPDPMHYYLSTVADPFQFQNDFALALSASSLSHWVHSEPAESWEMSYTALSAHYITFEGKGKTI
jgi:hypothetical protein